MEKCEPIFVKWAMKDTLNLINFGWIIGTFEDPVWGQKVRIALHPWDKIRAQWIIEDKMVFTFLPNDATMEQIMEPFHA